MLISFIPIAAQVLSIYPNPFTNSITVKLNSLSESEFKITFTDVLGREIYTSIIESGMSTKTIPTSQLAQGVYWLKITNGKNSFVSKLIKE